MCSKVHDLNNTLHYQLTTELFGYVKAIFQRVNENISGGLPNDREWDTRDPPDTTDDDRVSTWWEHRYINRHIGRTTNETQDLGTLR